MARLGGFLLLTPGGDTTVAEEQITALGLSDEVDHLVVAESASPSTIPWALIVVSAVFAVAGIFLLDGAARKSRDRKRHGPVIPAVAAKVKPAPTKAKSQKRK